MIHYFLLALEVASYPAKKTWKLRKVIEGFASKWQAPDVSEGFGRLWRLSSDADQESTHDPPGEFVEMDLIMDMILLVFLVASLGKDVGSRYSM